MEHASSSEQFGQQFTVNELKWIHVILIDSCLFQRLIIQRVTKMEKKTPKSNEITSKSEVFCFCTIQLNID